MALHWGTLLALGAYFWRDWAVLLAAALRREGSSQERLFWGIAAATVPAVIAGFFLKGEAETHFRSPTLIAWMLLGFGLLLGAADSRGAKTRGLETMDLKACLWIGLAQALALVPGVSRSGITITAGLFLGFKREDAARFSFLMSAPIVAAAGVLKLKDIEAAALGGPFWTGIAVSALSGYAAIWGLLRLARARSLWIFAAYRVGLAILVLLLAP